MARNKTPPPMHRKRRLREPVKIHRRRRNCSTRAVTLLCVFTSIVSQAFLRRVPCPREGWRRTQSVRPTVPRAGNLFCRGDSNRSVSRWWLHYIKKSGLLTEISRRDFSAAGLSGLSLPDARYEHTSIRANAANLTKN